MLLENILTEFAGGADKDRILHGLLKLAAKSKRGVSLVGDPMKMITHLTGVPNPKDYTDLDPQVQERIVSVIRSLARSVNDGTLTRKKIPVYMQELLQYEEQTRGATTRYDTEGL